MRKRQIIREKFWSESQPTNNLDFVEISLPHEAVDDFLRKYAKSYFNKPTVEETQKMRKKKERLVYKILKAGSLYFTDRQWQIFVHRYICSLKEVEIAAQLSVDQSYIASVLKACHLKLQKILGMRNKKYLRKIRKIPQKKA